VDTKFGFALNETWIFNSFIFNETNIKALKVFLSIIKSFRLYNNLKNHSLSGLSEGEMCLARYSSHIYTLKYKEGDGFT
jgi:hypothetical protein